MDSNKNEDYTTNSSSTTTTTIGQNGSSGNNGGHFAGGGNPAGVDAGCIVVKAVSAAKYQNHFNNNNLIEQENLMPPVNDNRMLGNDHEAANGVTVEVPMKDKVFSENGSTRSSSLFAQLTPPTAPTACRSNGEEQLLINHTATVECLTNSFSGTTNGVTNAYLRTPNGVTVNGDNPTEEPGQAQLVTKPDDGLVPMPDEGDNFSDNNSIGNLSYISENGLVEEIILLPNNAYSDDDNGSTSDDCIYAYRGGEPGGIAGQLLDLRGDQPPDDETDFLEMDFDPEPSSEMENFDSHREATLGDDDGNGAAFALGRSAEINSAVDRTVRSGSRESSVVSSPHQRLEPEPKESHNQSPDKQQHSENDSEDYPDSSLLPSPTGAAVVSSHLQSMAEPCLSEEHATKHEGQEATPSEQKPHPECPMERIQDHQTGAIPKNVPSSHYAAASSINLECPAPTRGSSNSKNLKLDLNLCGTRSTYPYYDQRAYVDYVLPTDQRPTPIGGEEEEEENSCLDCAEQQFLMATKQDHTLQRQCRVCSVKGRRARQSNAAKSSGRGADGRQLPEFYGFNDTGQHHYDEPTVSVCGGDESVEEMLLNMRAEQLAFEALNKVNALKETPPSGGHSQSEESLFRTVRSTAVASSTLTVAQPISSTQPDQEVPLDYFQGGCPEHTVTIYTINCGELTIIEALTRIGVAPNLDVLRQYFNEQYEVDTSKMNIPKYLLHMSKRDCNYKKLIEAIKSCCDDETLDVQYYPLDPFSDAPEIVQISSCEIAKRWTANTNLRQLIHFKHKHFHTLNVLGKIVNILRQPSRGRHTNHIVSIPQYYKSGSITITRIDS
ncbi:uncharacterized protein LOC126571792 [Anopheles aquasalis]|uniref:uncharacterized protein LOC126571792 n=1 Tax=Anopheles aquasalis TaxID=42839 RepID=UPI00215A4086|nr:uncharacterized protein LOC126571792 [Anopheles aquasalis]